MRFEYSNARKIPAAEVTAEADCQPHFSKLEYYR